MKKPLILLALCSAFAFAAPLMLSGKASDVDVHVKTLKDPIIGANTFRIELSKNGKPLNARSVKLKVFMPEMPGMPAMGEEVAARGANGAYTATAHVDMKGTWQVFVTVVDTDMKTKRFRTSANF